MSSMDTGSFGPASAFRFSGFREGSLDGRRSSFRYPSPWWDSAHMEMPRTVKHLFRWCLYHMVVNPLVSSVVRKMATYPITQVIIDAEEKEGFDKNVKRWNELLFRVLNIHKFQVEAGLDYNGYGNCVVSILFPFHKHLQCRHCNHTVRIKKLRRGEDWDFRNFDYHWTCPKCGATDRAIVKDIEYRSFRDIKLIRWNPSDLDISFNPILQTTEYAYEVPADIRAKIVGKNWKYLEEMPHNLIRAVKRHTPFRLNPNNVFHFKAPTPSLSSNDAGWGYPPILPALKDSFYLQILKKANEAIMMEHLVPLDILFPASPSADVNPWLTINLADWKRRIEMELQKWRWDPNYKPIMPLPVGYQRVGGNGRALMPVQEIRVWSEHIVAGMGVPQEFVFGGLSWTGSSVSLRMLENHFLNYREMHQHFLQHFLIPTVARFMRWEEVSVHMKAFKMADDMQMKQLLISLNQMKKASDKTLLSEFDKDYLDELRQIERELRQTLEIQRLDQMYKTTIQGESQVVLTRYQIDAQELMQEAQQRQMAAQGVAAGGQPGMVQDPSMAGGTQPQAGMGQPQAGGGPSMPGAEQQQEGQPGMGGEIPMGQPAAPVQPQYSDAIEMADAYARKLSNMDEMQQARVLDQMAKQMPQMHKLVLQKLSVLKALGQQPLPEQRPPRRDSAVI